LIPRPPPGRLRRTRPYHAGMARATELRRARSAQRRRSQPAFIMIMIMKLVSVCGGPDRGGRARALRRRLPRRLAQACCRRRPLTAPRPRFRLRLARGDSDGSPPRRCHRLGSTRIGSAPGRGAGGFRVAGGGRAGFGADLGLGLGTSRIRHDFERAGGFSLRSHDLPPTLPHPSLGPNPATDFQPRYCRAWRETGVGEDGGGGGGGTGPSLRLGGTALHGGGQHQGLGSGRLGSLGGPLPRVGRV
jgi:hypothetical protein